MCAELYPLVCHSLAVVKFPVSHLSLGSADSSSHATPLLAVASGSDGKEGQPLMVCELPSDLPDKMESGEWA